MLWGVAHGQSIGYLRYDSVRIERNPGNGELILLNGTRDVFGGVLTNIGNGRTAFVTPSAGVNYNIFNKDSIVIDPTDSVRQITIAHANKLLFKNDGAAYPETFNIAPYTFVFKDTVTSNDYYSAKRHGFYFNREAHLASGVQRQYLHGAELGINFRTPDSARLNPTGGDAVTSVTHQLIFQKQTGVSRSVLVTGLAGASDPTSATLSNVLFAGNNIRTRGALAAHTSYLNIPTGDTIGFYTAYLSRAVSNGNKHIGIDYWAGLGGATNADSVYAFVNPWVNARSVIGGDLMVGLRPDYPIPGQTTGSDLNPIIGQFNDASAILQIESTTKGFLPPRMTQAQREAIAAPATGLQVYQTDGTAAIYYYDGGAWNPLTSFAYSDSLTSIAIGNGNFVQSTTTYYDPTWMAGIHWSKIIGAPWIDSADLVDSLEIFVRFPMTVIAGSINEDGTSNADSIHMPQVGPDSSGWMSNTQYNAIIAGLGGTPNANIGAGYRLLKSAGQEIKTLFDGLYLNIDSTTNTNGLTILVDTATMFPQIRSTIPAGGGGGSGDVVGPGSATDNAIALFDGTTGKLIKNSTYIATPSLFSVPDAAGVVIGGTAKLTVGSASEFQIQGTGTADASGLVIRHSTTNSDYGEWKVAKNGDAAIGSSTVVANGEILGAFSAYGAQQTGTITNYTLGGQWRFEVNAAVTSGPGADMPTRGVLALAADGAAAADRFYFTTTTFVPANAGVSVGTTVDPFDQMNVGSGGSFNLGASDTRWVDGTDYSSFINGGAAAGGYRFDNHIVPTANDGAGLGSSTLQWSDLDLASGAVTRWNNSETLTHATDAWTWAGGKNIFAASATGFAAINIPDGVDPTSPVNGDIWQEANHFYGRLNGVTYQLDQQAGGSGWGLTGNASTVAGTNYIGTSDNVALDFRTNATQAMRITDAQELLIGTTTDNGSYHLQVNGNILTAGGFLSFGTAGSSPKLTPSGSTLLAVRVDNSDYVTLAAKYLNASTGIFSGNISTVPSALIHSLGTTEQLRFGYDASNYGRFTVASTGSTTLDLVGTTPVLTISDSIKATLIASVAADTVQWKPLVINAAGNVKQSYWAHAGGGGGGTSLSDNQIPYALSGNFVGGNEFTFGTSSNLSFLQIGSIGVGTGNVNLAGFTSGSVTIKPQAAAGTYNFNLPTSAGSAGQAMLSGGGGSTAMTFGTLGVGAGGTGATATPTNGQLLIGNGTNFSVASLTSSNSSITITPGSGTLNIATTVTLAQGSYTPTITNVSNVTGTTASTLYWYRVGDRVTVFGELAIDPTTLGQETSLRFDLPVSSALGDGGELSGSGAAPNGSAELNPMLLLGDATNDAALINYTCVTSNNVTWNIHFSYIITGD